MSEAKEQFRPGDIVQLRSGSPDLTVFQPCNQEGQVQAMYWHEPRGLGMLSAPPECFVVTVAKLPDDQRPHGPRLHVRE
ncbi:MAG: hypothetical protein KGL39_10660 [Patescibacteria group bacterium]|nr:hypothetical protein [Patescibacteria group bacterium]